MLIAIDYDDTFTADPEFWQLVIEAGQKRGHRFLIVTARLYEFAHDINEFAHDISVSVYCTNGEPKRLHLKNIGVRPDVWIDDLPESVGMPALAAINQVHVKGK